ncbi:PTS sorbitol transporter subunit IIA [Oceanobacillus oncorhynchi subsp. incaldanensis]|uniref:PTS glucitol/sorbitol transporter subunit IIA n=1 Tax=Oceanobacillus aidingensis TaxID=645964 RepID=A0ABV9JTU4_9BACI|nr:PTS glucitol/sorbitol transporter subunit IIA [Oceanobacillus oncorhynchi]MDM8101024.1 PTS glucitol/sorbitol transporter subunit IIA [Oceanobacillus oncorhynchi]GIO18992.1 PTS sorbitol transporter subunit IIA [Oceanobacillus oncorhynchi subsp. incaldanensis]
MYQTTIKSIGKDAKAFEAEKMMVLFGDNAPNELADFCYVIDLVSVDEDIAVGDILKLDNVSYQITSVGDAVRKNLNDLGHITLKFDGSTTAGQSGSLYLEEKEIVDVKPGSTITIEK